MMNKPETGSVALIFLNDEKGLLKLVGPNGIKPLTHYDLYSPFSQLHV